MNIIKHLENSVILNNVYFSSLIGGRETNEDAHIIFKHNNIEIYGICDGHGGNSVSKLLSELIPILVTKQKIVYPLSKQTIIKLYNDIQQKICKLPFGNECGSTCILIIIFNVNNTKHLYSINVGDSRSILCSFINDKLVNNLPYKIYQLSYDHKPIHPLERKRIEQMGGIIKMDGPTFRIGDLSLSRAFGDCDNKYTHPTPDIIHKILVKNDKFIVLACDGLFDVVDNETVTNIILSLCYSRGIRKNKQMNIAEMLANFAIENGSTDNVSVIVIFLD